MNRALLYLQNSEQAKTDFQYAVQKYFNLIIFKNQCTVLDIGCGPGNITCDGLFPLLPHEMKTLVGVDISTEFLNYAKLHYQKDHRIRYEYLNITNETIADEYFDNIFSFYCLHFIQDQGKAIENISIMLKPGDIVTSVFGYNVPLNMVSEFIDDVMSIMKKRDLVHIDQYNEVFLYCPYVLLTVLASKLVNNNNNNRVN